MKPSEKCKAIGLKSLRQTGKDVGVNEDTLVIWDRTKPKLFKAVLIGAAVMQLMIAIREVFKSE